MSKRGSFFEKDLGLLRSGFCEAYVFSRLITYLSKLWNQKITTRLCLELPQLVSPDSFILGIENQFSVISFFLISR